MNPILRFEWDQSTLQPLREQGLERALFRTLRMSGGDAIRAMRTASNRAIRFRKRMKASSVTRGLVLRMPRGRQVIENLEWRVDVSGASVPLSAYPYRQIKSGVSVAVNKGKRKHIKGAFVARMQSNHVGIFVRRGKGRLPIDELFSTRISDVFSDHGMVPAVFARGSQVFSTSFARLLPLELAKAGAK